MINSSKNWHPESWQSYTARQQASYPNCEHLNQVISELSQLPPLVSPQEIEELKQSIASAAKGDTFILQGGDCAEMFSDCSAETITSKLKILLQMSLILADGLNKPVVKIGRIAGQYAKPRSAESETLNGVSLPCYRGDIINGSQFDQISRTPDPERLLKGYSFASLTLNYLRTLFENEFTALSNVDNWDLDFVSHSNNSIQYKELLTKLHSSLALVENLSQTGRISKANDRIYTCHEALHLHYEQALTRTSEDGNWYNLSTHLPWVGMRTCQLDSAHLEYIRGINNPIAIKVSTQMKPEHLLKLADIVDPDNTPGRLTLITRFGEKNIAQSLPPLIKAMQSQSRTPLWCCDPMHGNTSVTKQGKKTRSFKAITNELSQAFVIHKQNDSHLGGVHFELTGEKVTECIGGARGLAEIDLHKTYKSLVDPRLNAEQSLEIAMLITQLHKEDNKMEVAFNPAVS